MCRLIGTFGFDSKMDPKVYFFHLIRIDRENVSSVILLQIQEYLLFNNERNVHEVLVTRTAVGITEHPNMTLAVDHGFKPIKVKNLQGF